MLECSEKLGIFGGSFDPIHKEHVEIAHKAIEQYDLDKVIFVPTALPPHKAKLLADKNQRFEMVQLAVAEFEKILISRVELDRKGISYTVDTLFWFKEKYPKAQLYLIIGEDSFFQLSKWREPKKLMSLAKILIVPRTMDRKFQKDSFKPIEIEGALNPLYIKTTPNAISSTKIKKELKQNEFSKKIPLQVMGYIKLFGLYDCKSILGLQGVEIYNELKKYISIRRIAHSISVMMTAIELARAHKIDYKKVATAGLLHDCGKELSLKEMQRLLKNKKDMFSERVWNSTTLLHGYAGAELVRKKFKIEDEDIIRAISSHTLGRIPMTYEEIIIFLSDMIEPNRIQNPKIKNIKNMAFIDLKQALKQGMEYTIYELEKNNKEIEPTIYNIIKWVRKGE